MKGQGEKVRTGCKKVLLETFKAKACLLLSDEHLNAVGEPFLTLGIYFHDHGAIDL
jgi:hypothetical protein